MIYAILDTVDNDSYIFSIDSAFDSYFWMEPGNGKLMLYYRYKQSKARDKAKDKAKSTIYKAYYEIAEMYIPVCKLHKIEAITQAQYETLREFDIPNLVVYRRLRYVFESFYRSHHFDYAIFRISYDRSYRNQQ